MKWHGIGFVLLPALLIFCGCASTKSLRPEDAPYSVLSGMRVSGLQQNSSLSHVIGSIESELSTRYTNHPPFRFYVAPAIRSLKIYSRLDTLPVNEFLRYLRQDTGVYIATRKQKVFIEVAPASSPFDLFNLPTCNYMATTATIFEAVSDMNMKLEDQYGTNVPIVFSASMNISTNETMRFIAGTPSIKVYSDMVAYATLSNYRRSENIIHFINALADEDLIIEPHGSGDPTPCGGASEP